MDNLSIAVAFTTGFVSFLSPCVLPILPGFLAYLAGTSFENVVGLEIPAVTIGVAAKEKLEIVNVRGGAVLNFPHPHPSYAKRGKIPFELFQKYTAIKNPPRCRGTDF